MAGTGDPAKSPTFRVMMKTDSVAFATVATTASSKSANARRLAPCQPAASRFQFENGAAPDPARPRPPVWRRVCAQDSRASSTRGPGIYRPASPSDHAHHLCGRRVMRLTLLEDIQKHVDVQRHVHACFFSRCSRCVSSPATDGEMMPVALITSGCSGLCKCSRKLRACRARNASAEVPWAAEYSRRKAKSSSGNGIVIVLMP